MDPQKDKRDRMKDMNAQSDKSTEKPYKTIRQALDEIEQAAPEDKAELMKAIQPKPDDMKAIFDEMSRTAKLINEIKPFMDLIFDTYSADEWFMYQPLKAITMPIGAYMQSMGLEDGSAIESHKEAFLEFFGEYIADLEKAYKEYGEEFDLDAIQREMLEDMRGEGIYSELEGKIIRTQYPITMASPTDKVSKKLFAGELTDQLQPLAMERKKSKRPIDTLASVTLQSVKGMTWYDGGVYSAICALYVRGNNEYITPQMIHQAMTGKEEARLSQAQAKSISDSIAKAMREVITIDATEEGERHKIQGSLKYGTNLLHAEWVRRNLNGTITECYHILKTPVLYEYAASKNQIANPPIAALATPVNKNEDTTALQAYLLDRIWGIKGGAIEHNIAYNTIYNAVWGKEASSKARIQKSRLRSSALKILDHWTKPESGNLQIKGFSEYMRGKTAQGIRIEP